MSNLSAVYTEFETELEEVQAALLDAADDLGPPLGELVRAQIKRTTPPIRAAFTLAIAVNEPASQQRETQLRDKRIQLAAALEMLYIALHIHRVLVNAAAGERHAGDSDDVDRSFVGSTILAGDYCFSRAAQMAAATEVPEVVAIFSQALQRVSEEHLRHQFEHGVQPLPVNLDPQEAKRTSAPEQQDEQNALERSGIEYRDGGYHDNENEYDENAQLLISGAQAGAILAGLDAGATETAMAAAHTIGNYLAGSAAFGNTTSLRSLISPTGVDSPPNAVHHLRRQALLTWLAAQHQNGSATPSTRNN